MLDLGLDEAIQIWCDYDFVEYFLLLFLGQNFVRFISKELLDVGWNPIDPKLPPVSELLRSILVDKLDLTKTSGIA